MRTFYTLFTYKNLRNWFSSLSLPRKSNNLNFPFANISRILELYPTPSEDFPSVYNATSAIWRDAHMLCLAHNLGLWRTKALGLPVWRYRFDLVADNLNSQGSAIGAFHGTFTHLLKWINACSPVCRIRYSLRYGVWNVPGNVDPCI